MGVDYIQRCINDNSITRQDYPDPDVIRLDDTYYMVSTTMYYFPGGAILRSYDLVNWEIVSYIFDKLDGISEERLENNLNAYGKGMWAPSFRYHEGKFYVAFVSHNQPDTHLFVADNIEGPWEHRKIKGYYHDCSILFDEGRVFLVHGNTDIRLTELSSDMSEPKKGGTDKIIISDNPSLVTLGYEGSHIYKINNKYVITLIHWPKGGMRTESVFISDKVEGPYIGRDCLSDDRGYCQMGVAQGGLVDTLDGKWFSILFQDSGAVGRIPVLVPVEWKDGYPIFGVNNQAPREVSIVDNRPGYQYEPLSSERIGDDTHKRINKQWQWNHVPDNSLWTLNDKDEYTITTGQTAINPLHAKNTLTQRCTYPGGSMSVRVDYSNLNVGDTAGLMILLGTYVLGGVRREEDGDYYVVLVNGHNHEGYQIGCNDYTEAKEIFRQKINDNNKSCVIKIQVDFTNMKDEAEVYINDQKVTKEPIKLQFKLDLFTGARYGLCMYSKLNVGGSASYAITKSETSV